MIPTTGLNITIDNTVKLSTGGAGGGSTFIFNQALLSNLWLITHNLNMFPAVTTVDSGGNEFKGGVRYVDANTITISCLGAGYAGTAYLNY